MSITAFLFSVSFWGLFPTLALALGCTFLLAFLLRRRFHKSNQSSQAAKDKKPKKPKISFRQRILRLFQKARAHYNGTSKGSLGQAFKAAFETLRLYIGSSDYRYRLPFYLMVGPEGSGKQSIIDSLKIPLPVEKHPDMPTNSPCQFSFFDSAVLMNLDGRLLIEQGKTASYKEEWRLFLNLLLNARPGKPLDGMILCISVHELLQEDPQALAIRASYMHEKIQEAQEVLGVKIPIYLVITQVDALEGFQQFSQAIPAENRDDIFGWASPYPLDIYYQDKWVGEAFSSIMKQLLAIQQAIFVHNKHQSIAEGLTLFPYALQRLQPALEIFARHLFQRSSFNQSALLRGIFFTGQSGQVDLTGVDPLRNRIQDKLASLLHFKKTDQEEGAPEEAVGGSAVPQVVSESGTQTVYFTTTLFQDKIFAEQGLAVPIERHFLSKIRSVRLMQMGTALFLFLATFGLFYTYQGLLKSRNYLMPRLEDISNVMQRTLTQGRYNKVDHLFFQKQAQALLPAIADLRPEELRSWLIPFSWFSPIETKIQHLVSMAYHHVIFKAIAQKLEEDFKRLIQDDFKPKQDADDKNKNTTLFTSPSFSALSAYLDQLVLYESMVDKYNNLKNSGNVKDFSFLVKKLFGYTLPAYLNHSSATFYKTFFSSAQKMPPLGLFAYEGAVLKKFDRLKSGYIKEGFRIQALFPELVELNKALKLFRGRQKDYSPGNLLRLSKLLSSVISFFTSPQQEWLRQKTVAQNPAFQELTKKIALLNALPIECADIMKQETSQAFLQLKGVLASYVLPVAGHLFTLDDAGRLTISPSVLNFQGLLNLLLAQPFMRASGRLLPLQTQTASTLVIWQPEALQRASSNIEKFNKFFNVQIRSLPAEERHFLKSVCQKIFEQNLQRQLYSAQDVIHVEEKASSLAPEESCSDAAKNLRQALPALSALLSLLQKNNLSHIYNELRDVTHQQAMMLLEKVDAIYESESPYMPRIDAVKSWTGNVRQILAAFGAASHQDLKNYTALQRERVSYLAKDFAKPATDLLKLLYRKDASHLPNMLMKWSDILTQLNFYDRKAPNTLQMLEDFILKTLPSLKLDGCPIILHLAKNPAGIDYFLDCINNIRDQFEKQCFKANHDASVIAYDQISDYFNQNLAGRYPFVPKGFPADEEVSLDELKSFFQIFDTKAPFVREMLRKGVRRNPHYMKALRFISSLEKARPFFRLFVATMGNKTNPSVPLEVTFRSNKKAERHASHLISWTLNMGDKTYFAKDNTAKVWWEHGSNVSMLMRWAVGSNYRPVPKVEDKSITVEPLQVKLSYGGTWGLIKFLQAHKAKAQDAKPSDDDTRRLRFQIPLSMKEYIYPTFYGNDILPPPAAAELLVFMDVKVVDGPDNSTLDVPIHFPHIAPSMDVTEKAPKKKPKKNTIADLCRIPPVPQTR